ncbi:MAG: nitrilase-related carbon-nitrogen hydrolase [Ktedonobacterales bacterium]
MSADDATPPNVAGQPSQPGAIIRVIAVGNRINLAAAATEASYCAELERIVGLAVPHLAPDHPNLLVLTEVLGLPAALTGPPGALARRAPTASAALTVLALAHLPRIQRIRQHWPRISFARALLLARADALYRPFAATLSRLAATHSTHIVATTLAPHGHISAYPDEIACWGRPGAKSAYVPDGPEVYNAALVFGPDGRLLDRVDKVFLTHSERTLLDLTPGKLDNVRVIPTSAGRLGVAISLDAFTPDYLRHLDAQQAEIVVQPDANDQLWAAPSQTHR